MQQIAEDFFVSLFKIAYELALQKKILCLKDFRFLTSLKLSYGVDLVIIFLGFNMIKIHKIHNDLFYALENLFIFNY